MKLKALLPIAALAALASPASALLYSNTAGTLFWYGGDRTHVLDDVNLDGSGPQNISSITVGIVVDAATGTAAPFDLHVLIWDDLDFAAGATDPVPSNLTAHIVSGAWSGLTGSEDEPGLYALTLDLTGFGGIDVDDPNLGVELRFNLTGTEVASPDVTELFAGGGPTVGTSEDIYWSDDNPMDGVITGGEGYFFGGEPLLSNFYLEMDSAPVPEPASMAILGMGALALLRRRRK